MTFTLTAKNAEGEQSSDSVTINVVQFYPPLDAWFSFVDKIKESDPVGAYSFLCDRGLPVTWDDPSSAKKLATDLLQRSAAPLLIQMGSWIEFGRVKQYEGGGPSPEDVFLIEATWHIGSPEVLRHFTKTRPGIFEDSLSDSSLDDWYRAKTTKGEMVFVRHEGEWRFEIFAEQSHLMKR